MKQKIDRVKLLIMDVDGVLTDGRIVLDEQGREIKSFDVKDGYGLVMLRQKGIKTAIISARSAKAVSARAKDLNIDKIFQDAYPKLHAYEKILKSLKLTDEEACFIGDDLPDVPVMERVGFAVAVPSAVPEVKRVCDYITQKDGGAGAVREVVELILKTQGKWNANPR